ncbi:MAG: hypothetical protein KDC92_15640, partial [Bacteroidetes bacterium]|nr:hypothetical protein [Bacteroidota bacterium]
RSCNLFYVCGIIFSGVLKQNPVIIKNLALIVLLACLGVNSNGQMLGNKDSAKTTAPKKRFIETSYLLEDSILLKPNQFTQIDTTLPDLTLTSNLQKPGVDFQQLHHVTSAALPLSFNPFAEPGIQLGFNHLNPYWLQSKDLKYYNTYTPYTQLRYYQGGVDERLLALDAEHSQNFGERFNFSAWHRSRKTNGLYLNEGGQSTRLGVNARYYSVDHRYQLLLNAVWNNFTLNDNGGLANISEFNDAQTTVERLTTDTWLDEATSTYKNMELSARQLYYIGKNNDVLMPDSSTVNRIIPRTYFTHKITYLRKNHQFTGAESSFYPRNVDSFDEVMEILRWREFRNEIGWGLFLYPKRELESTKRLTKRQYSEQVFYGGIDVRNISVQQWGLSRLTNFPPDSLALQTNYFNVHLFGKLRKNITPYTHFSGDVNYVTVGSNFSDYFLHLKMKQTLFKGLNIIPELKAQARTAQHFEQYYNGAFGIWENDFKKAFNNELAASLVFKENHSVRVAAVRADNYLYFDENALPSQAEDGINFIQAEVKSNFHLGKFYFNNRVVWQQINQTTSVTMPEWIIDLNYYFQSDLFKKALLLRVGFDFRYFSAYTPFAFMPGINQFYAKTERSTGGYPMFDAYISARVKHWNGFVKFEHVSEGLFGYSYELLPNYMAYPRMLRWGVAWRFYN